MLHYVPVTLTKRIREQKVNAHLFLICKLSLGFGLDFEFGLGSELVIRV